MSIDEHISQAEEEPTPTSRKKKNGSSPETSRQKKQIASFLVIVTGVLMLLSMVSYSSADEASGDIRFTDLYKVFTHDPLIQHKAETTSNWLGIIGAIVSNFFINSTVGFFSFTFPFLVLAWGWVTLRRGDLRRLVYFTNYILALSLLGSTLFGLVRYAGMSEILSAEWHGALGAFFASILRQMIGLTGGIIVAGALLFVTLTLAIDLDLHKTSERVKGIALAISNFIRTQLNAVKERRALKSVQSTLETEEIKVKRPERELAPISAKKIIPPPVTAPEVELPIMNGSLETSAAIDNDVPLEILEGAKEEEVELEEREVEDEEIDFVFPSVDLLDAKRYEEKISDEELKANAALLKAKLADFDVEISNVSVTPGPVVTLYELVPAPGVKVAKIVNLSNDLALAMQAKGIRIEAPIPGKGTVGVEIPNHKPSMVTIRSVLNSEKYRDSQAALPLAMGKTINGEVFVDDLAKMPHLLIAGATGMGKSVGINAIIASLLYRLHPSEIKFVLVDPKKIELNLYLKLQNHYLAVSEDVLDEKIITTPQNAVLVLKSAVLEMENRYTLLAAAGVRHITDYNQRFKEGRLKGKDHDTVKHRFLPYIIIIIDELADLMLTAAKDVEEPITRIAQLARAVGIHLVLATQRPSVDVITGVIKANFPSRIAYAVSSKIDSRTIIDGNGAEQLLGRGDMLYLSASSPRPIRMQNAFISTEEVEALVEYIGKQKGYRHQFILPSALEKKRQSLTGSGSERDELFEEAARIIVRHQQGSVSLLQRRLKVGYSRAARLVDELEAAGIVGPFDGSKAREVMVENEADLEVILRSIE